MNIMCSTLRLNSHGLSSFKVLHCGFNQIISTKPHQPLNKVSSHNNSFSRGKIRAVSTVPESKSDAKDPEEPPLVDFAFVHVTELIMCLQVLLLLDGSPDVHFRRACGRQKLRDIMLDNNIELYGPYARPLLNCGGGGTCATCMVEVIVGKELLSPRTDREKEKLKRKSKKWRLPCQTTVGNPESRGTVVIQQLPEWKAHEWGYESIKFGVTRSIDH